MNIEWKRDGDRSQEWLSADYEGFSVASARPHDGYWQWMFHLDHLHGTSDTEQAMKAEIAGLLEKALVRNKPGDPEKRADAYRDLLVSLLRNIDPHTFSTAEYAIHHRIINLLDKFGDGKFVNEAIVGECGHINQALALRVTLANRQYEAEVEAAKTPAQKAKEEARDHRRLVRSIDKSLTQHMAELLMMRRAGYRNPKGYGAIVTCLEVRGLIGENGRLNELGCEIADKVISEQPDLYARMVEGKFYPRLARNDTLVKEAAL